MAHGVYPTKFVSNLLHRNWTQSGACGGNTLMHDRRPRECQSANFWNLKRDSPLHAWIVLASMINGPRVCQLASVKAKHFTSLLSRPIAWTDRLHQLMSLMTVIFMVL